MTANSTPPTATKSPREVVEAAIGFPPGTQLAENYVANQRKNLESWLILRGISQKAAQNAQIASIANAYASERYFAAWLVSDQKRNAGRTVRNIGWDESASDTANNLARDQLAAQLLASEAEALREAEIARQQEMEYSDSSNSSNTKNEKLEVTREQIARAADAVISSKLKDLEAKLSAGIANEVRNAKLVLGDEAKAEIRKIVTDTARTVFEEILPPRTIDVRQADGTVVSMGMQHAQFPTLLRAMGARNHRGQRLNIWLTGPTGSGKTSACEAAAKALGLAFGSDGSLDTDYKVLGFTDANGHVVSTQFIKCYTTASVYVADEIDNWLPSALVSLNAALANGWISTPAGIMTRHKDSCIIACANTWGLGATNDYVGRSRLDAASLDRFRPKIDWPYDEAMEMAIARESGGEEWCRMVQRMRRAAKAQGLQIIISPRATFDGIGLLEAGFSWSETVEMAITSGLKPEQIKALGSTSNSSSMAAD